jgi:heme-degrading monooxygenase HmoA
MRKDDGMVAMSLLANEQSRNEQETAQGQPVYVINVFRVAPEHQEELIVVFTRIRAWTSAMPGFLAADIYRGLEGGRVTYAAAWRSAADIEAMRAAMRGDATAWAYAQRVGEIANTEDNFCERVVQR